MSRADAHLELALPFKVGETFVREVAFTAENIRAYATLAGDDNPMHHDLAIAERSRFGGLIASGTQTSAVMMGAVASFFVAKGASLGLGFSFKLRRAVKAETTWVATWRIDRIAWKQSLSGYVVDLSGQLLNTGDRGSAIDVTAQTLFLGDGPL